MHQSRVTRQVGSEKDQLTDQGKLPNLANRCEIDAVSSKPFGFVISSCDDSVVETE